MIALGDINADTTIVNEKPAGFPGLANPDSNDSCTIKVKLVIVTLGIGHMASNHIQCIFFLFLFQMTKYILGIDILPLWATFQMISHGFGF